MVKSENEEHFGARGIAKAVPLEWIRVEARGVARAVLLEGLGAQRGA